MLSGHSIKSFISAIFILSAPLSTLWSIEIVAQKSDTFIFEGIPSGEFSKSDFLATAHVKGERAIAYLPFVFRAGDLGIQPENDEISDCKLTLFIKSLPSLPQSNARDSSAEVEKLSKREIKIEEEKDTDEKLEEKIEQVKEYVEEKSDAESKTKVVIALYAICDQESFEPNARNFRVSWDGKHDGVAPKHNTLDNKLDQSALYELGKIEFDIESDEYEDGDRYEFVSPELNHFVRFVLGITTAHNEAPPFRTSLSKIENATIIIIQKSGPSGVFFFSADSMNDKVGKEQSGDEVEKSFNRQKKVDASGNVIEENSQSQSNDAEKEISQATQEINKQVAAEQKINAAKSSAESANEGASATKDAVSKNRRGHQKSDTAKGVPDTKVNKSQDSESDDDEFEIVRDVTPDYRPRIDFECRRQTESAATATPAPDDSIQQNSL